MPRRSLVLWASAPRGIREHVSLSRSELGKGIVPSSLDHQFLDKRGVDDGAAGGDPFERIDEVLDFPHPSLQQVADALPVVEEIDGCFELDVCREEEDADLGELGSDCARCVKALGRVRGRHADIQHHNVGDVRPYEFVERRRVVGLGDDVVSGSGQDSRDPLA